MPFLCPECAQPALEIEASLELPPDAWWDEITLQLVRCARCTFKGAAVYQESRRGALDSEAVDHWGCRLREDAFAAFESAMKVCPDPRSLDCPCAAHLEWSRTDDAGFWLNPLVDAERFPMLLA